MRSASQPSAEQVRKTGGLRERKKARTKAAIQQHAIRLFREQGYAATTVEQIAEAAEVSASTVFRYFPTKEELVTTDLVDPMIFAAFRVQPPELSLVEAWRRALIESFHELTESQLDTERGRGLLTLSVRELWAASLTNITAGLDTMTALSAERVGREPTDAEVRNAVGALFGVLLIAVLDWYKHQEGDFVAHINAALDQLESGIML
ncbi:TetR/AcrR family transcriptional regulator [Actinophytocola gossypii]|uniref:TetR family transcriptional regulator n=1 Tax=Actinophytocola gossypii TaxID=2812003 RepID=A0ABT2JIP3_9PSEU|nr:TetR/AcrR family transcriptional regulator [Actinophytocola gossypii]MCT2587109.1 TetR family transcriptional regulator [Actinophytocola gossypii]